MAHRPSPKIGYGNQELQLSQEMQQENNLQSKIQRGSAVLILLRNGRGDLLSSEQTLERNRDVHFSQVSGKEVLDGHELVLAALLSRKQFVISEGKK